MGFIGLIGFRVQGLGFRVYRAIVFRVYRV